MPTPDLSPPEHLAAYHHRINNIVIHLYKNGQYGVMAMSVDERPPPDIREALYHYCLHAKDITSVGEIEEYGREGIWKLTLLRISKNQFIVKFRPTVFKVEESDEEYDGEMD
jgi:hypothetical protein